MRGSAHVFVFGLLFLSFWGGARGLLERDYTLYILKEKTITIQETMDAYIDELVEMFAPQAPRLPRPEIRAVVEENFRGARRPFEDAEGRILNPRTGKRVLAAGKVGRAVLAAHRLALEEDNAALPRGVMRGLQPARAVPGVVERDDEFMALRRGYQRAGAFILQRWNIPGAAPETVSDFARAIAGSIANANVVLALIGTSFDASRRYDPRNAVRF